MTVDPFGRASDPIEFNKPDDSKIIFRRGATEIFKGSFVIVLAIRDAISGELSPDAIEINVAPPLPPSHQNASPAAATNPAELQHFDRHSATRDGGLGKEEWGWIEF